ncbi:hypothetical protein O181_048100 [Austropuccinia psidii MF-1]|uniref:Uncharacterized protein n=1 Tax=Austropuccinia psidii MF-1 TaxID=1389203 RepID=A0A9Q3DWK7_9BASI|nr:hypothetical protein [Austropuccinia psidii MF-1]
MEGAAPSRRGGMKSRRSRSFSGLLGGYLGMSEGARARLAEAEDGEGEESAEEEDSERTEVAYAFENAPETPQGFNLTPTNQPLVSQSDPSLLKIMEQMATIMGHLSQAAAPRDNFKAPEFKTTSMKAPYSFDGTQAHKLRGFIQFHHLGTGALRREEGLALSKLRLTYGGFKDMVRKDTLESVKDELLK